MKKIIFVCLGNICRSPMAEIFFRDMLKKSGYKAVIESKATSSWEVGSPVHAGTKKILDKYGLEYSSFRARQLTREDCDGADYLIGMDEQNVVDVKRIAGKENERKISRLLDYTPFPRDVADPWYTGDFDSTERDVKAGLDGLLKLLIESGDV